MASKIQAQQQGVSAESTLVSNPAAPPPTLLEATPQTSDATSVSKDTPMPPQDPASLPPPGATAPAAGLAHPMDSGAMAEGDSNVLPPVAHMHTIRAPPSRGKKNGTHPPLTLNQLAIVAASQNKLPTSRVKGIVTRMGRHTQASASKLGRWYKNDNYVDNGNYSWRNMELFIDYQQQMYTPCGTIKASCKK